MPCSHGAPEPRGLLGLNEAHRIRLEPRSTMTTTPPKQRALDALKNLPPDATIEDAIERLLFIAKVEKGIADADADRTVPHDEVVKRMKKR